MYAHVCIYIHTLYRVLKIQSCVRPCSRCHFSACGAVVPVPASLRDCSARGSARPWAWGAAAEAPSLYFLWPGAWIWGLLTHSGVAAVPAVWIGMWGWQAEPCESGRREAFSTGSALPVSAGAEQETGFSLGEAAQRDTMCCRRPVGL